MQYLGLSGKDLDAAGVKWESTKSRRMFLLKLNVDPSSGLVKHERISEECSGVVVLGDGLTPPGVCTPRLCVRASPIVPKSFFCWFSMRADALAHARRLKSFFVCLLQL